MDRTFTLICQKCGKKFKAKGNRVKFCSDCFEKILYESKHTCSICKKIVEIRDQNGRGYECGCHNKFYETRLGPGECILCGKFSEKRNGLGICSECCSSFMESNVKSNQSAGYCTICNKYNSKRDQNGRGLLECNCSKEWHFKHSKNNIKSGYCCICGVFNVERDQNGRGVSNCNCHNDFYKKWFTTRDLSNNGQKLKFCNICNKKTIHNGNICLECSPRSRGALTSPSLIIIDKIYYYYDKDPLVNNYIPWNEFKNKFAIINVDFLDKIQVDYPTAKIIPTFREQNSDTWKGAKEAFEQSIIEQGISWCAYIKFYIDENNDIKPLVIGKTGTTLAKYDDGSNKRGGSDVCFSEWDPEDADCREGPARLFLYQNNLNWDKTQILVVPCKTEQEAYFIESSIALHYNLFLS